MVRYTLIYFTARGRAEPARMIFAYARVDYVDRRIERTEWPALKKGMHGGQLPVLEVTSDDGESEVLTLGQSVSICRYLGGQFGLVGRDRWESAQLDAIADFAADILHFGSQPVFESNERKQALLLEKNSVELPNKFRQLVKLMGIDKDGGSFALACDRPSWADFVVAGVAEFLNSTALQGKLHVISPMARAHLARVHALPGVNEYIARRPTSNF